MKILKLIIFSIFFLYFYTSGFDLDLLALSSIPNVTKDMENPFFWIKKIKDPNRILLTENQIQKINQENLKRQELYLCDVISLKEKWSKEDIFNLFNEDLQGFLKPDEFRYGKNGRLLDEQFWKNLLDNMNRDSIRDITEILFGLVVYRTDIRVFPTDEIVSSNPNGLEFDRFQHSAIMPGAPIAIYSFSRDNQWAYVQTSFIRGWIKKNIIGIAKGKNDVKNYLEEKNQLLLTGDNIKVFTDPFLKKEAFSANMGCHFPVVKPPEHGDNKYFIRIPSRNEDGSLLFKEAYVSIKEDVYQGFLPYTQRNIAIQAFKLLNKKYGWGDKNGGIDCSRLIMDVFSSFGIIMPRNSKFQAQVGKVLGEFEKDNVEKKIKILDEAPPFATLLRLPGHIMLYIGKHNGRYYVIHSIWGIQTMDKSGSRMTHKIGKVTITDLSLGESGPDGSLLHRITDIRLIGDK